MVGRVVDPMERPGPEGVLSSTKEAGMSTWVGIKSFTDDREVFHGPYETEAEAVAFHWRVIEMIGRFGFNIAADYYTDRFIRPARPGLPAAQAQAMEDDWQLSLRRTD